MIRMTSRFERPRGLGSVLAVLAILLSLAGHASAQQAGGQAPAGGTVAKQAAPKAAANGQAGGDATKPPPVKVAGNFGQWALVCAEPTSKDDTPPCNLVQALVEKETQKLVFRVSVGYGPKGNLILRIDGPTGVALQKGLEFSPGAVKSSKPASRKAVARCCSSATT